MLLETQIGSAPIAVFIQDLGHTLPFFFLLADSWSLLKLSLITAPGRDWDSWQVKQPEILTLLREIAHSFYELRGKHKKKSRKKG